MPKHNASKDGAKNKQALGQIKRGNLNAAAEILKTTSNNNKTAIKNRITKGVNIARKTQG